MKKYCLTLLISLLALSVYPQHHILPLWEGNPPLQNPSDLKEEATQQGILRIANVQHPIIEVYLPTKQNSTGEAVVIFPGGGYGILAYDWEGTDFAKWLNSEGIAGIVVKYRLPISKSLTNPKEVPLMYAQRALRLVRKHAAEWSINPAKIGVMGFSAGGHLASTLSTQYKHEVDRSTDEVDAISARPDF